MKIFLSMFLLVFVFIVSTTSTNMSDKRTEKGKETTAKISGKETERTLSKRKPISLSSMISCRNFKRGTCKQTKKNTISSDSSVTNQIKCQQLCFVTEGCGGFTFHPGDRSSSKRRCVLFRDCRGGRGECGNCISGPIMPRISECLSAKQEMSESEDSTLTCPTGCVPDPLVEEYDEPTTDTSLVDYNEKDYSSNDGLSNKDLYEVDYVDEDGIYQITESKPSYTDYDYELEDYDYDYDNPQDDAFNVRLDEDALKENEEEEDDDIQIEEGFLTDNNDNTVEILPSLNLENIPTEVNKSPPLIIFFILLGGFDSNGSISRIDLLNTGLGNSAQSLSIAPLPVALLQGGPLSSAFTDRSITSCGRGWRSLSPYGYQYNPGSCYSYGLRSQRWEARGGKMRSFRKGASVTKLGRYLLASGGSRKQKSLSTMEVFDPKKPEGGWRSLSQMRMPTGVSEHCTVSVEGRNGKEVVITGGRERRNRAMKLNLRNKRWYSLNVMNHGRSNHACIKTTLNGRAGLIVSGGSGLGNSSLSSVEFYDAKTGTWLNMPSMRKGRSSHVMTITKGKLMVAGGERKGRKGPQFLDDVEIFTGKRWVKSKQKLDRPRSGFSLVKIPKQNVVPSQRKLVRG